MTKAALPLLKQSTGSVLNIGSVAGLVGVKRRFAYCATKGAVIAMTRQLAVDYPTEIRANCIAPGTVDSPFVEGYLEKYHRTRKKRSGRNSIKDSRSDGLAGPTRSRIWRSIFVRRLRSS